MTVLGLLGSGEFEPWAEEVDRWLLERATGDGRVLIFPAASAPEGDEVFDRWAAMGLEHYARQGIPAEVVPVKTREDADWEELAARLGGASMAFFSGGNPAYLAQVLAGSRLWDRLLAELRRGMAYGGCSAGVACLGTNAPDSSITELGPEILAPRGLELFPEANFGPHWDMIETFLPGAQALWVRSMPPGTRFLAIDERTALLGDGTDWRVVGAGAVHLFEDGSPRTTFLAGSRFRLPLSISLTPGDVGSARA